ncbi:unnamed protein product [Zymoseptoria tritici ST99CH_1E4]|uniref:Uncharacterized protein n=1 Tax=Zymoseptoria tritici ST99CH_1E4 TaxID=1276532 RepID=A0A2H1FNA1_ZYMTR|nr:unnamed protein product [Zymoseptoria tritici ST99CH_1E4]
MHAIRLVALSSSSAPFSPEVPSQKTSGSGTIQTGALPMAVLASNNANVANTIVTSEILITMPTTSIEADLPSAVLPSPPNICTLGHHSLQERGEGLR